MDGDEMETESSPSHSQQVTADNFKNLYVLVEAAASSDKLPGSSTSGGKQQVLNKPAKRSKTLETVLGLPESKKPFANNKFSPLFVEDDFKSIYDNISVKSVQQQIPAKTVINAREEKNVPKQKSADKDEISSAKSAKFCPPIFIENVNLKALIAKLSEKLSKGDFKVKNISNNRSKLFIKCPYVHAEIMNMFKLKEISSYSFTPVQLRQTRLILRGLVRNMEVAEIIEELESRAPGVVDEVTPFTTKHSRDNNVPTGLFMVVLKSGCTASSVAHIKQIAHQIVKWEKPHSSNKIVQCKRCQKWGHIARNCNRPYVCVKCDKDHLPGECALSKDSDVKPFCANCRTWGHPASFSGCPAYTNFKNLREGSNNKYNEKKVNSHVSDNRTFANVVKKGSVPPSPSVKRNCPDFIKDFLNIAMVILDEANNLESRIIKFMDDFQKWSVSDRKKHCISLL